MFRRLIGNPMRISSNQVDLELGGVCYLVTCPKSTMDIVAEDEQKGRKSQLLIHEHITEEKYDLYGFDSASELELFRLLLRVKGIGPKAAIAVCSLGSVENVRQSIRMGAVGTISNANGVSEARAKAICLELGGKC